MVHVSPGLPQQAVGLPQYNNYQHQNVSAGTSATGDQSQALSTMVRYGFKDPSLKKLNWLRL